MKSLLHLSLAFSLALVGGAFLPSTAIAQCVPEEVVDIPDEPDTEPDTASVTSFLVNAETASSVCFQSGRAAAVLSDQPDLLIRRDIRNIGPLATQDGGDAAGYGGPIWASIAGRQAELNENTLDTGTVTLGADVFTNDNTIIGVMVQGDVADQTGVTTSSFEATGYMAGVYGIYQTTNFTFDGRLLGGQAETDVTDGTNTAEGIESTRWLATLQISTQRELDAGTWLVPRASLGWLEDRMDAYTIGGSDVDEVVVSYGQFDLGASIIAPVSFGGANGNVIGGVSGIRAFGEDADSQVPPDLRGRVDLGLEFFDGETWSISTKVFADGFGDDDYVSIGADLGVMIWF